MKINLTRRDQYYICTMNENGKYSYFCKFTGGNSFMCHINRYDYGVSIYTYDQAISLLYNSLLDPKTYFVRHVFDPDLN